jgi:hypothetical protein
VNATKQQPEVSSTSPSLLLSLCPPPTHAEALEACRLARQVLCHVPELEGRPRAAIECAEAWATAQASAEQYCAAVARARLSAAACAAEAAARASRLPLGSTELLAEELLTQAALAARRACAGDVVGVRHCLTACTTLVATSGVYS